MRFPLNKEDLTETGEAGGEVFSRQANQFPVLELGCILRDCGWVLIVLWMFFVVVSTSFLSLWVSSIYVNLYLIQPILWLSVAGLTIWFWKKADMGERIHSERWFLGLAAIAGFFQIAVFLLSGLLEGFGYSPYGRQFLVIVLNIWFVGTRLLGQELARWYILISLKKRNLFSGIGFTWLILTLVVLPVTRLLSFDFSNVEGVFRLFGNSFLPVASENILATYLAFVGGPLASLIYRGELAAFEWLSPILPNLDWILSTFLGTIVPVLGVLFVREMIEWRSSNETDSNAREKWGTGWILTSIVLVFLLWFNSGLFAIRPTLVSGISMEPAIKPGDIVITREVSADGIKTGDVVLFDDANYSVLHRVVEIRWLDGNRVFFTKGDNVNVLDNPWGESQLRGKMVLVVPKLGWIPIGMKMLFNQIVN